MLQQSKMRSNKGPEVVCSQLPVIVGQTGPQLILSVVGPQAAADSALRLSTVTLLTHQCQEERS